MMPGSHNVKGNMTRGIECSMRPDLENNYPFTFYLSVEVRVDPFTHSLQAKIYNPDESKY